MYFISKEKISLFILLLFLQSSNIFAQIETSNWYFGDKAGLDFNNGLLTIHPDGEMSTPAGCSSISDKNGDLLFYTNGQTVWNKNHNIMTGGSELITDINNIQTSIIVPKPNDENVYYIFTTRETITTTPFAMGPGLFYTEIIFSNEFPLGQVSQTHKNIRITTTISGRITAIHHAESNSIRVIAFGSLNSEPNSPRDTFYIYNVTEDGIQFPATIITQSKILSGLGGMKISPDGTTIAIADYIERYVYIYTFDNDNQTINFRSALNPDLFGTPISPYSVEFSQDSKYLYFSGMNLPSTSFIFRFNLYNTSEFSTKDTVSASGSHKYGTLQLASNGKIYIANYRGDDDDLRTSSYLGVINKPEKEEEEFNFQNSAINLNPGHSFKGLPNFVASFLRNRIITENKCVGDFFDFDLDAYTTIAAVTWDFGDGNTSTEMTPSHQFSVPGEYIVRANITINNNTQPLYKLVEVFPLPEMNPNQTLKQCDIDNDGMSNFNLNNISDKISNVNSRYNLAFYNTYNDANNNTNVINNPELFRNVTNPQEIFVKITSPKGCVTISNFFIETTYTELGIIENIYACENSDAILYNGEGNFDLTQKENEIRLQFNLPNTSFVSFYRSFQDAETKSTPLPQNFTSSSSSIWVRVDNEDYSCNGIASIQLIVNPELIINIKDSYIICSSQMQPSIILDGGISNEKWEWKNNSGTVISTGREYTLQQSGTYSLTVYKTQNGIECSITKTFIVYESEPPTFNEVKTENNKILISVNGTNDYEFSLDDVFYYGSGKSHTFTGVRGGIYTIFVRDKENCDLTIKTQISVINYPSYFSPNNDGYNDNWKIQGIEDSLYNEANIHIYDRYGKLLFFMDLNNNNKNGWNGIFNGKTLFSNDYWFRAVLIDKENNTIIKNGHFSLIR